MVYRITAEVSIEVLDILFNDLNIWFYINKGHLQSLKLNPAPARNFKNASSVIIKHLKPNGKHIATTHCIKDNETGKVLHWDPKDIVINDVCLWRY